MLYSDFSVKDAEGNVREILKVSKLCFGSLCMGPLQSALPLKEGAGIIKHALDCGVNFIDTAQLYGTYPYIREALEFFSGGDKDRVVISTKTYAHTRKLAEEALKEAVRGLGRNVIDIFMLHEQESIHTIYGHIEALEYLFEQKKAGIIKAVGVSTHCVDGVAGAVEFNRTYKKDKLDVIHPMYNMTGLGIVPKRREDFGDAGSDALHQMETALIEAKKSGFFIFSMKSLGGGNLFSKAEEALAFAVSKPFIDSVAVGMKSVFEVDANVTFFETGQFPGEYYKNYAEQAGGKRLHIDGWCEGCGKCVSVCPSKALKLSSARVGGGADIAVCDNSKCVLCGYCSGACDSFAIKII